MKKIAAVCGVSLVASLWFISASPGVQKKEIPAAPQQQKGIVFNLEKIRVERTRSLLRDTLHVSLTVKVGTKKYGPYFKHLGNHGDGTINVNLATPHIVVAPNDKVMFNYVVLNSGHKSEEAVEQAVTKGVTGLLGILFDNPTGKLDWRGDLLGSLVKAGIGVIFADCDGVVAADQLITTGAALNKWQPTHRETRHYPGTDSAVGCGRNSIYDVTWSAIR